MSANFIHRPVKKRRRLKCYFPMIDVYGFAMVLVIRVGKFSTLLFWCSFIFTALHFYHHHHHHHHHHSPSSSPPSTTRHVTAKTSITAITAVSGCVRGFCFSTSTVFQHVKHSRTSTQYLVEKEELGERSGWGGGGCSGEGGQSP